MKIRNSRKPPYTGQLKHWMDEKWAGPEPSGPVEECTMVGRMHDGVWKDRNKSTPDSRPCMRVLDRLSRGQDRPARQASVELSTAKRIGRENRIPYNTVAFHFKARLLTMLKFSQINTLVTFYNLLATNPLRTRP